MCRPSNRRINHVIPGQVVNDKPENPYLDWSVWLVAVVAVGCYLNSLRCGLVFDDQPAIRDNKDLRPSTPLTHLLYDDFWGTPMHQEESHKSYRPACVLTFRLNYWLHELNASGYHLVNVLLHAVVCCLFYRLCRHFLPRISCLVAALLFAVHPIHTEAVSGVVGRAELLSSVFFLLSLHKYVLWADAADDYKKAGECFLWATLAMLSKEQGITVVAVCATYDIFLVRKTSSTSLMPDRGPRDKNKGPTPTWRKDLVLRLLLLTAATVAILAFRIKLMGNRLPVFNRFDNPAASSDWPVRHLTYQYVIALNAWLLLFPSDLCCDWTMGTVPLVTSLLDLRAVAAAFFYIAIFMIAWKGGTRASRPLIMGVSLCGFPFVPASNLFFAVGFVVAERVLYLPSMGFCVLVAHGWTTLLNHNRKYRPFLHVCLVMLLCLNATKTVIRNFDWESEESLFKSGLRVTRANAKLYNNLGHVMEAKGKKWEALSLFHQAAEVQPDDLGSHLNVGRMYNALGMPGKAEEAFRQAKSLLPKARPGRPYMAHIAPRHLDLFLDLGDLLSQNESRLEEAQQVYMEAISMKSDYIGAYMQRASVLLRLNRSNEAHDMYKEALKHDHNNPDLLYNIGVLLLEQGKSIQALARFDQALKVDPAHEKSLLNYAILTQDSDDSSLRRLAHERLQTLLGKGLQPERSYFNLGMLAMQDGRAGAAEHYFRSALQIREDFASALFNLGLVLYEQGRPLESIPYLVKLQGRHLKGLALLGNIYFSHLRNYSAAMQCYQLILQQEPTHIAALHNLCATYFELGHLEQAETCLLRAKMLAPGERYIQQHLDIIRQLKAKERHSSKQQDKLNCSKSTVLCKKQHQETERSVFLEEERFNTDIETKL